MIHVTSSYGLPPRHQQSSPIKLLLTPSHPPSAHTQSHHHNQHSNNTDNKQHSASKTNKQLFVIPNSTILRDINHSSAASSSSDIDLLSPSTPIISSLYDYQCNTEVYNYSSGGSGTGRVNSIGSQSPTSTINIMMRDSGIQSPTTHNTMNMEQINDGADNQSNKQLLGSGSDNITPVFNIATPSLRMSNAVDSIKFTLPSNRLFRAKSCSTNTRRRSLKTNFDTATTDNDSPTSSLSRQYSSLRSSPESTVISPSMNGPVISSMRNDSEPLIRATSDTTSTNTGNSFDNDQSMDGYQLLSPLNNFISSPRLFSCPTAQYTINKVQRSPCPSPPLNSIIDNANTANNTLPDTARQSYDSSCTTDSRVSPDIPEYMNIVNLQLPNSLSPQLRRCESDAGINMSNALSDKSDPMNNRSNSVGVINDSMILPRNRSKSYMSDMVDQPTQTQWVQQYNLFRSQSVSRPTTQLQSTSTSYASIRTASSIDVRNVDNNSYAQPIRSLKRHHIQLNMRSITPRPRLLSHADRIEQTNPHSIRQVNTIPTYKHKLPLISSKLEGVHCVSVDTVSELFNDIRLDELGYDRVVVIDCRFGYEYAGGHLPNAINITDPNELEAEFFHTPPSNGDRICIIFHCEYSQHRGPKCCRYFRKRDREIHGFNGFPNLFYPELYVMDGGYKKFHESIHTINTTYIAMNDKRYRDEWIKCWKLHKYIKKQGIKQQPISQHAKQLAANKIAMNNIAVTQSIDMSTLSSPLYSEPNTPVSDSTDDETGALILTASQTDEYMCTAMDELSGNMWDDDTDNTFNTINIKKFKLTQLTNNDCRSSYNNTSTQSIASMLSPVVSSASLAARTQLFNNTNNNSISQSYHQYNNTQINVTTTTITN